MAQMTDIMVDVETTGLDSARNAIIQLSAIKFNYDTGEIGAYFDRCPMPLPFRYWDDSTREFWLGKHRDIYEQIVARAEPAPQVFADFEAFAKEEEQLRFWAKPIHFDWNFVASHYEQLDRNMPFYYRTARDTNSFISALHGTAEHVSLEVDFHGDVHNALHDCAHQIETLFAAKKKFVTTEIM